MDYTKKLGIGIGIIGLFNIQFIVDESDQVFIIEVNPRSSRTVPFLSKATGYSLADIATLAILGVSLPEQGITELYPGEKKRDVYKRQEEVLAVSDLRRFAVWRKIREYKTE